MLSHSGCRLAFRVSERWSCAMFCFCFGLGFILFCFPSYVSGFRGTASKNWKLNKFNWQITTEGNKVQKFTCWNESMFPGPQQLCFLSGKNPGGQVPAPATWGRENVGEEQGGGTWDGATCSIIVPYLHTQNSQVNSGAQKQRTAGILSTHVRDVYRCLWRRVFSLHRM